MNAIKTLKFLIPYLKPYSLRIAVALLCVLLAKLANVGVPLVMKRIVDSMSPAAAPLAVPVALLAAYGVLRLLTAVFTELREVLYIKVVTKTVRSAMLSIFGHLQTLSMRFHADRQTGRLIRDVERGEQGIMVLIDAALFSILPTMVETALVFAILIRGYDWTFSGIAFAALALYVLFTMRITEWRNVIRREMNEYESTGSARVTDSLLNYETVKYFSNEEWEKKRYDDTLIPWEKSALRTQASLGVLNTGQAAIIALAVTLMMWRATVGTVNGTMTVGDLVLVSSLMIQLYIPLNFLGVIYRQTTQAFIDMEKFFTLSLAEAEIKDTPDAVPLKPAGGEIRFDNVNFGYNGDRQILHNVSFTVKAGDTVAVVGPSGAGKSTLSRLLFRFYDLTSGGIYIDGQDIRTITQDSLRKAVGIVPQDTVLFNDTIGYNIAYGRTDASVAEIEAAAGMAQLDGFIQCLPCGYDTLVGERGLKLSGGEKQRVAIARTLLKNPLIYVFDEATSSLDSRSEKQIQAELDELARGRTTLMIAHRLSTVVRADEILVLDGGHIVERGPHTALLAKNGLYARMWQLQQAEKQVEERL